jgi:hypothetical protein
MLGLARRIGCAIILLIAGAALWHFRDRWLPGLKERLFEKSSEAIERVTP